MSLDLKCGVKRSSGMQLGIEVKGCGRGLEDGPVDIFPRFQGFPLNADRVPYINLVGP